MVPVKSTPLKEYGVPVGASAAFFPDAEERQNSRVLNLAEFTGEWGAGEKNRLTTSGTKVLLPAWGCAF